MFMAILLLIFLFFIFFYDKPLSREVSLNRVLLLWDKSPEVVTKLLTVPMRDLPIYTAGLTGAMRVKFLAQANNNSN